MMVAGLLSFSAPMSYDPTRQAAMVNSFRHFIIEQVFCYLFLV